MTWFSQRDPMWANLPMGDGTYTIGQAGCLITSVSSMLADWGVPTDPYRLDQWLGISAGYFDGSLFVWRSVEAFGVKLVKLGGAIDPALLKEAVEPDYGIIVMVDANPSTPGVDRHWVLVVGLSESGELIVADPWYTPVKTYPLSNPLAYAIYERVHAKKVIVQHGTATEHQTQLRIASR